MPALPGEVPLHPSVCQDFLLLTVEGHALAGVQGGDRHAERNRVIVSSLNVGVRLLIT